MLSGSLFQESRVANNVSNPNTWCLIMAPLCATQGADILPKAVFMFDMDTLLVCDRVGPDNAVICNNSTNLEEKSDS